jgi:hypothetical protein
MGDGRIVSGTDIVSGQNDTNATIAANIVVMKDATVTEGIKLPTAVTDACFGVTLNSIADGKYGPVQRAGRAVCTAAAAITAGAQLMTDTAGKVLTWTASGGNNAFLIGTAVGAAGADGDLLYVDLDLGFKQG